MIDAVAKAFVIGHPVAHSRSPMIHGYWLKSFALPGRYEAVDIAPEALEPFLHSLADQGYKGGNVTLPLKEETCRIVDTLGRLTTTAATIGAINTLYFEDGVLIGDNTDAAGFIANLDATLNAGWHDSVKTVLVLGAGGAARAVIAGLSGKTTATIFVANRTRSRAEDLRAINPARIETLDWRNAQAAVAGADLIVNTTSLGMAGQPPLDLRLNTAKKTAIAADIVYVPLTTPLLREAELYHLRCVDGLGMLLHQAVPGFARWFGKVPQVTNDLRRLIEADLAMKAVRR